MRTTLRYVGRHKTTFIEVGELEPDATFTVPDDRLEAFLRRADVELVEEPDSSTPSKPSATDSAGTRQTGGAESVVVATDPAIASTQEG